MSESLLADLSRAFATSVSEVCEAIKDKSVIANELLRSSLEMYANIRCSASSYNMNDFISTLKLALKGYHETELLLLLLPKSMVLTNEQYVRLNSECAKIGKLLESSINSAIESVKK